MKYAYSVLFAVVFTVIQLVVLVLCMIPPWQDCMCVLHASHMARNVLLVRYQAVLLRRRWIFRVRHS